MAEFQDVMEQFDRIGINPIWSSEIEPYPLRVTAALFVIWVVLTA